MFVSDSHHPQLLGASAYRDEAIFVSERQRVLQNAWHCVGCDSDIANVGDFFTTEVLGHPIIIRRGDESIHAHINVCAHRFCTLSDESHGHAKVLKCPYHGWEYSDQGDTRRIPDAPSFRPLKKGQLGLTPVHLASIGRLLFVCVGDPSDGGVEHQMDGHAATIAQWFSSDYRPMMTLEETVGCNWKTYLENGLESYHVETVHADTLGTQPDESTCHHDLWQRSTRLTIDGEAKDRLSRVLDRGVHRMLGLSREPYRHVHVYPTLTFIRLAMFTYLESILPVSATRTRVVTRGFVYRGQDRFGQKPLASAAGRFGRRLLKKIQDEDFDILRLNQAGIASDHRPRGGFISAREERIAHFQRYIVEKISP